MTAKKEVHDFAENKSRPISANGQKLLTCSREQIIPIKTMQTCSLVRKNRKTHTGH